MGPPGKILKKYKQVREVEIPSRNRARVGSQRVKTAQVRIPAGAFGWKQRDFWSRKSMKKCFLRANLFGSGGDQGVFGVRLDAIWCGFRPGLPCIAGESVVRRKSAGSHLGVRHFHMGMLVLR